MSHNFKVVRLGGGCGMRGLETCSGYATVDFRNTSFAVTYKKSLAASMNPFSTASVPQGLERAVPVTCILVQSIRPSVVAYQNPELASTQADEPDRQTASLGRNTALWFL
jgi:hypothetical protein